MFSSPRPPHVARRSGFTMIEMLVVFVVFAATVMIAIRSVGDTLRRDRLGKTAVMLSSDLEQAFAIAARQRAPVRLLINDTSRTFSVADRADTTFKYRTRNFTAGEFTLDSLSPSRRVLDVMPTGLSTDTLSLRIGVLSGGKMYTKTIRMTRAGLVRVGKR